MTIQEFTQPIADYINGFLTKLVPGAEIYLVAFIAIILGYSIKSRNNWNKISFALITIVIFAALRYFGIGGA